MSINVAEDPWALIQNVIPITTGRSVKILAEGSPRIVCNINNAPWYKRQNNYLPAASFPFKWGDEIKQSFILPTSSSYINELSHTFTCRFGISENYIDIQQENTVGRFKDDACPENSISQYLTKWINWVIHSYQELYQKDSMSKNNMFGGIARKQWADLTDQFSKSGANEARMSLIVQLASDRLLNSTLKSISQNPRKVLRRIRQELPLSRIQQLDAACIRDYARRPGRDSAEKAGPRQQLLAVNRIENTDTLENRVTVWVLNEIYKKVRSYTSENGSFKHTPRVKKVRRIGFNSLNWISGNNLSSVATNALQHPVTPNYPLQLDRRYRKIYNAYKLLLNDEKVHDDAWEWQRNLWSCSARSFLYGRLTSRYKEIFTSYAYLRSESNQGQWVERPIAPGPISIEDKQYYIIDSADIDQESWISTKEIFPGAHLVGMTGCDLILYCPQSKDTILIWLYYWTGTKEKFFIKQEACLKAINDTEQAINRQGKEEINFKGFIIGSYFKSDSELDFGSLNYEDKTKLVSVLLPFDSYDKIDDFDVALDLVIGYS